MGRTSRGLAAFVAAGLAFAGMAPAALAQEESGTAASPHGPTGRTGGLRPWHEGGGYDGGRLG